MKIKDLIFYFSVIYFTFSLNTLSAQEKYEPSVIVLAPNEVVIEDFLKEEIKKISDKMTQRAATMKTKPKPDMQGKPENVKIMVEKSIDMQLEASFSLVPTSLLADYLSYRFFEKFQNCLIYPLNLKASNEAIQLSKIAKEAQVQYVINISKIHFYGQEDTKFAKLSICVFDNVEKKCVLEKTYIGNAENKGFEFACEEGTVLCTVNNAIAAASSEIINLVATNSPTIKREKALSLERSSVLIEKYYSQKPNPELPKIIQANDKKSVLSAYYQGLMSADKTKFIAFFLEDTQSPNFKNTPAYYAYLVLGVFHQNKWYVERQNATYFDAKSMELARRIYFNNLQKWHFFEQESTKPNPNFWETHFFAKEEKQENKDNTKYVGLYQIVANALRQEQKVANEAFEKDINAKVIAPVFEKLKATQPDIFTKIDGLSKKFPMIYPAHKEHFICPVLVTDQEGDKTLRFFFFDLKSKQQYEWVYFEEKKVASHVSQYGGDVVYIFEKLTQWNWNFETLDDSHFWNSYILPKENGKYKFLQEVK